MKTLLNIILAGLLSACVGKIDYTASAGDKSEHMQVWGLFGGSEAFETAGGTRWTGNRNKSFGQAMQAAAAVAGSVASASVSKAQEVTKQKANDNATAITTQKQQLDAAAAAQQQADKAAAYKGLSDKVPEGSVAAPALPSPSAP